ncbi:protransforming growth factor alpha [Puma concolor]|uniref:Protransforming growth factor alpha n=1 Tax=Puma concolor TaxID=9696 RepID=A0A6P6IK13_PUMCO|nr:protransforming growth factor alpha [Puma concolor]
MGSLINLLRVFILTPQTPRSQSFSSPVSDPPVAAAVVSHFNDCPDSHSQFCFHGTCRFLVQEDKPACVCHSGYVGARCEHADLLAVVAASQKKQAITALVVVSIVALAVLIIACVLIHCCQVRKHCEWCQALICRHEKPSALLKGRTACCHSETGKGLPRGGAFFPQETQLAFPLALKVQFQKLLPLRLNQRTLDLGLTAPENPASVLPDTKVAKQRLGDRQGTGGPLLD